MSIRNDIELVLADTVTAYLQAVLSAETQAVCPVVSFHDPMSVDEADRIVVLVPQCVSEDYSLGNFECTMEIAVKTQWTQPNGSTNKATHFSRLDAVADALTTGSLIVDLQALSAEVGINHVSNKRARSTKIYDNGFIVSEIGLTVHAFTTEVA